ncbi:hypothetical protein [Paenibacillus pini]|uniref:Uncharacterized protein n=1 Tax=Paenibacillus pini JCM 16418 TaxID=1236976 RepID=W7YL45_9BACL|nr:hypothetical protein [Paenibacillus pini]GAF09247.1 hypothetical protein JCM16418_3371 [Paenibacillus pini JCM 16418]
MNYQIPFKKMALSAMMLSAVVAPVVTNADSAPKDVLPMANSKAAAVTSATVASQAVVTISSDMANPMELVKTYAPNTLEEWQKTLDQYKKLARDTSYQAFIMDVDKANHKLDQVFEIDDSMMKELSASTTVATEKASKAQYSIAMDKDELKSGQTITINADKVRFNKLPSNMTVSVKATEAKNLTESSEVKIDSNAEMVQDIAVSYSKLDQAFVDAQAALIDAAESKNAGAIKEALSKLLEQYKLQIAELETAK